MKRLPRNATIGFGAFVAALLTSHKADAGRVELIGVHFATGDLFRISTSDASATRVGGTGIPSFGSLELRSDGFLYGFTAGDPPAPTLYRIDPRTYDTAAVGPLDLAGPVFEGSLAFAPNGMAYGANHDNELNAQLFTIDMNNGAASVVGTISGGTHDINGMVWRSDGMLVGLDRATNALLAIDPLDAGSSEIAVVNPVVGAVGGMAAVGDVGFFTTSGPDRPSPGTNELYRLDLYTGAYTLIGTLSPDITGAGISGLALPEPSTLALLVLGCLAITRHR